MWLILRTLCSRELLLLGLRDLQAHKLRTLLTTLGMVFGVGAVICMLSIGEGASAEQLESIRLLGSQNILLRSVQPAESAEVRETESSIVQYGLTRDDVARVRALPHVSDVVLARHIADSIRHDARRFHGAVVGVTDNYFRRVHLELQRGRPLTPEDGLLGNKVCILGARAARELFPQSDPLGAIITVSSVGSGSVNFTVVGVLAEVLTAGQPARGVAARDVNRDVYLPLAVVDQRFGDLKISFRGRGQRDIRRVVYSDVYVYVEAVEHVLAASKLIQCALEHGRRKHDYTMVVPLELLRQAEQTQRIRQIVLGSIAAISLLVGGIGIMNIMLASVTERTREIGIRRALGAKQAHITAQFLVQTLILSILGGLIGIVVGVGFAFLVTWFVDWKTIIPWWAVAVSFGVSATVGIVFGLYPARAAARLDPIVALNSGARLA